MNINVPISFKGLVSDDLLKDMPKEFHPWARELVARMDTFVLMLLNQLQAQPTIFTVNPTEEPEEVAGAKTGDFCVYRDDLGTTQVTAL